MVKGKCIFDFTHDIITTMNDITGNIGNFGYIVEDIVIGQKAIIDKKREAKYSFKKSFF